MIGNKLLHCERARAGIGAAGSEGRGLQRSSFSQQAWALPRVNLIGSQHVESRVRMHVVVPGIELVEILFGFGLAGEVTREGRMGLDSGKVRLDVRVVIGRARSAEQLWDAEFSEVGGRRVRAHLGTPVAERLGPKASRLIQQAFVDQPVIPQGLHLIADQPGADVPGDVLATPMIEQAVQVQEDIWLPGMKIGDVPVPQLIGTVDPVCIRCSPTLRDLPPAWTIAVQRPFVLPNGHVRDISGCGACLQG